MDSAVVICSEKLLQRYLSFLSKRMTENMVQWISRRLCDSRTITSYEAQVVTSQATDMQKASTLIQMVIKKGRNACSSFLRCLGICEPMLYETVTGCPVQDSDEDHHSEDILFSETKASYNSPCIINILNSSLNNCIIGNHNKQCVTCICDQHALLSQNDAMNGQTSTVGNIVDEMEDSQSHDQLIPEQDPVSGNGIHMESSHIEYVIIGDQNSMTVTDTEYLNSEVEEDTEVEPDVNG